jgi:ELWxxDGT repeat protein
VKRCAIALLSHVLLPASGLADPSPAYLIKDLNTRSSNGGSGVTKAVGSNGRAFVFVAIRETGWELWKSDGTPGGSQLVKVIDPSLSTGTGSTQPQLSTLA